MLSERVKNALIISHLFSCILSTSTMSGPPPTLLEDEKLTPPTRKFAFPEGTSDPDFDASRSSTSQHSRTKSNITESPPVTPRSLTFNIPPSNTLSLNNHAMYAADQQTPGTTPGPTNAHGYFPEPGNSGTPRSGFTSLSASVADLSRVPSSYFIGGSRPGTSDRSSSKSIRPASPRQREAFTSPRTRPMTMYSSVQPSLVKVERERSKSTMLTDSSAIQKPWIAVRDPYQRISYFVTYGMMFLGIALGAIRIFFGYKDVRILPGNMCVVMDENFESDEGLFGDNGKFFREVDMSGFGYVFFLLLNGFNSAFPNGYLPLI